MLLGCPWIHVMHVVPSTFHHCVKFPYNGIQITILGDLDPFQHCNNLKTSLEKQVLINQAPPPTSQLKSLTMVDTSTPSISNTQLHIQDKGCG